ncbi:MAG TPA: hypothetical protein H9695_10135 [Candidatus Mediterraneibacter excrementigallinarum]|nr:hypothetical protein [Candidatus Mediterraneibacter excrementigallinarum]
MEDLTFGEQVKIILGRKGMTIKELAETIEARTGKKMSRQNLTQRLGRDNFQEQDMRMIAAILECPFQLSIMGGETAKAPARAPHHEKAEAEVKQPERMETAEEEKPAEVTSEASRPADGMVREEATEAPEASTEPEHMPEKEPETVTAAAEAAAEMPEETESAADVQSSEAASGEEKDERDMTIGELYEIHEELSELEENAKAGEPVEAIKEELEKPKKERFGNFFLRRKHSEPEKKEAKETKENNASHEVRLSDSADTRTTVKMQDTKKTDFEPVISHDDAEEDRELGEVNPYTGKEYQSNSVRMHPTRIGYVQVYDRSIHKWTDMTEWAFLGYQERKKALLGKAYEPPIYLD